jgi:hypothetical protein
MLRGRRWKEPIRWLECPPPVNPFPFGDSPVFLIRRFPRRPFDADIQEPINFGFSGKQRVVRRRVNIVLFCVGKGFIPLI